MDGDPSVEASSPSGLPGVEVTDVASHPLGIIVLDGGMRERIVTIPNGVDVDAFDPARFAAGRGATRASLGVPAESDQIQK